jgi:hypothetical protein
LGQPIDPLDAEYLGLEEEIRELQEKVEPLKEEGDIWSAVNRIMNLSADRRREVSEIRKEIRECEMLLNRMAFGWVSGIIAMPEPSQVFKVVNNTNVFERELAKKIGSTVDLEDGNKIEVTPALVKFLTRFKFSIGTPPVTKKGMETIERILFGGQLGDIYAFRNLLGTEVDVFDRFMKVVDRTVEQSTHYTTDTEKKTFERNARDHSNMEGMRGFTKTAISGSSDTAHRMIKEHLFKRHGEGSSVIEDWEGDLNKPEDVARLAEDMRTKGTSMFVVKVKAVHTNAFAVDILKPEWEDLLARLIVIEDSDVSQKTTTTVVYSFHGDVTEGLAKWHVKDSGTLANTQLNLRSLMEGFSSDEIGRMKAKVEEKIAYFQSQGVNSKNWDSDRKKKWVVSNQKDYVSLQKFKKFLEFVEKIKTGRVEDVDDLKQQMITEVEGLQKDYFFKDLPEDEYRCIYVPQGGGRREIGLIGKYHLGRHRKKVEEFKSKYLKPGSGTAIERLNAMLAKDGRRGLEETALADRQSPDQPIREMGESDDSLILSYVREQVRRVVYAGARDVERIVTDVILESLDRVLGTNVPGILKNQVANLLRKANLSSAIKILDRPPFRTIANRLRMVEGEIRRVAADHIAGPVLDKAREVQRALGSQSLELATRMLNDINTKGAFEPSLALPEMGWSFGDVLMEEDFPAQNYISIDMDKDGNLMLDSLERKLLQAKAELHEFPELFELYCSSIILVFNDPHNPTSQVADTFTKIKLLDIASKYGLAILADEAYHKMIGRDLKEIEGDDSLASFYHNKFKGGPVTIYSSLPSTKWGMGAGRRSGNILTNDLGGHSLMDENGNVNETTFEEFVRKNIDGVNLMSLWLDKETLRTGLGVKKACRPLEHEILDLFTDPISVMDEILDEMVRGIDSPDFQGPIYFKLLEARNDMDRLKLRTSDPLLDGKVIKLALRQCVSDLVSELKEMRLDKQTRKDTEERIKAGVKAIKRLSKKIHGLEGKYIKPKGPFYLCVEFDETEKDPGLADFIEAFAKAHGITGVRVGKGEVRFSFGAMIDGTPESYEMLSVAYEKTLELSLAYWEKFKGIRKGLNQARDVSPTYHALQRLFPANANVAEDAIRDKTQMVHFHELLQESGSQEVLRKIVKELTERKPKKEGGIGKPEAQPGRESSTQVPQSIVGRISAEIAGLLSGKTDPNETPEEKLNGESELGDILNTVHEKDIALILRYLKIYKLAKAQFEEQGDEDAGSHAMDAVFAGGVECPENMEALRVLIDKFHKYKEKGKSPLVFRVSSDASKYVAQIQPDSEAEIVTIKGVECHNMQEFVGSKPFQTLFNYYLLKVKDKIPKLKSLTDREILGDYGALKFAEKADVHNRKFKEGEREIFAQIAMEIAKIWYSDEVTKVLVGNFENGNPEKQESAKTRLSEVLEGVDADTREKAMAVLTGTFTSIDPDVQGKAIIGTEEVVNRYIQEFLRVFLTEKQEKSLEIKPTFQVGYQSIKGVKANENALPWMKKIVESAEFAGQTVPTDPAPEMTTGGTARVGEFDYGIFRRDGDGGNAPKKEYFRERLTQFMENMNPKDYICKMVQVGPVKTLLVMHRSYSHYMAEEMRLFPQFDLSPEEIGSLEFDTISLMGIPRKAMGDDYKVGYYMEEDASGKKIPVSWVDAEKLTDYVGYLKKPLLTIANEKVKESGGMPVHGSAFTIVFKNGLRKTLVIGGDSGAGKSETIIAMIEQAIAEEGSAKDVEGIDMLAGDMLSMYEGEDNQMYMMGTEEGDFMRMSDISGD